MCDPTNELRSFRLKVSSPEYSFPGLIVDSPVPLAPCAQ